MDDMDTTPTPEDVDVTADQETDAPQPEVDRAGPPALPPTPQPDLLPPAPQGERGPWQKSPAMAAFLAIVPGLGHLYVGAYQRAVMVVVTFFLCIYLLPLPVKVFMALFVWFFGIFDAYRHAQVATYGEPGSSPLPQAGQGGLMFGVFLTVVGAVLLVDRFFPNVFEWLRDWWPALLILAGLYLIVDAIRARAIGRSSAEE